MQTLSHDISHALDDVLAPMTSVSPRSTTDEELYLALKTRQARALDVLFQRYGRIVYGLALKMLNHAQEAEDLTQDIFLALWRDAPRNPTCRHFLSYLLTLTRSRAIDKLRSRTRRHKLHQSWNQEAKAIAPSATPWDDAITQEHAHRVRQAMEELPDKQRQILEMAYDQGLSQTEIARQLNMPLGTVKTCTRQGLLKLRQLLSSTRVW